MNSTATGTTPEQKDKKKKKGYTYRTALFTRKVCK
jgi:hypothetical protein